MKVTVTVTLEAPVAELADHGRRRDLERTAAAAIRREMPEATIIDTDVVPAETRCAHCGRSTDLACDRCYQGVCGDCCWAVLPETICRGCHRPSEPRERAAGVIPSRPPGQMPCSCGAVGR